MIAAIDDNVNACACVGGAHADHSNVKVNSGLFSVMGRGDMINFSNKIGIVTVR